MIPSSACFAIVRKFEGLRLSAYADPVGIATIGYGHRIGRHEQFPPEITAEIAEGILIADLSFAGKCVAELVRVSLTQGQFDALADFVFNLGAERLKGSTLLRLLNEGKYHLVPGQIMRWNHAGGAVLAGLVARRTEECVLWTAHADAA